MPPQPNALRHPTTGGSPDSGPLSPFQQVYWYADRGAPGTFASLIRVFDVEGPLDPDALAASLDALVARHPALRTQFLDTPRGPVQRVLDRAPTPLVVAEDTADTDADARLRAALAPFDLERPPPLRVALLRQSPRRHTLVLAVHHIVCDGASLRVLLSEWGEAYAAIRAGQRWRPEAAPSGQLDVVAWQQEQIEARLDSARQFWRRTLTPRPAPVELAPGRRADRYRNARHRFGFGDGSAEQVRQAYRRLRVTPFVALLAGFKAALWSRTGQDDLAVGSLFAARLRPEFEGTVGLLANATVLRTSLAGDPSFQELAGRVRATVLDASDHQAVPIESAAALEDLLPGWSVWFNLLPGPPDQLALAGAQVLPRTPEFAASFEKTPPAWEGDNLAATVWLSPGEVCGRFDYNQQLLGPRWAAGLADSFRAVTAAGLADPQLRLSQLCRPGES